MAKDQFLTKAVDADFAATFELKANKLIEMLGVTQAIPSGPKETLSQYKLTGELSTEPYVKGKEIPTTEYSRQKVRDFSINLDYYHTKTYLEDIVTKGYDQAVTESDERLINQIQAKIKKKFITALGTGTGEATGSDFVECAADAWAKLKNASEDYGDTTALFFANPLDFAKTIANSEVFSAFGLQYIINWAGLGNLIFTNAVPVGSIYCTASGNVKVHYIPASNAQLPGVEFKTDETGYIAVCHQPVLNMAAYDTVAVSGIEVFPEIVDLVFKGTIKAAAAQASTKG